MENDMDETASDHGQEEPSGDREAQNHGCRDMDPQLSPRLHQALSAWYIII